MPTQLRAIAPMQAKLEKYTDPPVGPEDIRIHMELSAEKHGTGLSVFRGDASFMNKRMDPEMQIFVEKEGGASPFPASLGNMGIGRVTEVGEKVRTVTKGDRVFGYFPIKESHTVSAERVWPAPAGVDDNLLLCTDPAVVALRAIREAVLSVGDTVAIFGLGAIGLFALQLAKLSGVVKLVAVDPVPERRALAETLGADVTLDPFAVDVGREIKLATHKRGVDVALEVSGSYPALHQAIRATCYGGKIVPVSYYHGSPEGLDLSEEWHFNRQVMVSGARVESEPYRDYPRWDRERLYETVFHLFQKGALTADGFVHFVGLVDAPAAYTALVRDSTRWIKLGVKYA